MEFIKTLESIQGKKLKEYLVTSRRYQTYADVDDLIRDVGFKPNTSIDEGIKKFLEWYKNIMGQIMKLLYAHDNKFYKFKMIIIVMGFSKEVLLRYTNVFEKVKFVSRQ